jgi:hypothetical protein
LEAGRIAEFVSKTMEILLCREPECSGYNSRAAGRVSERVLSATTLADAVGSRVPALCFTGEHDRLCPPAHGRLFAARIDGARHTTVRHAVHLERAREFADLLARFSAGEAIDGLDYLGAIETGPELTHFDSAQPVTESANRLQKAWAIDLCP